MIAEISLALQWEAGGVGSIPAEEQNSTCLKVQPKKKKNDCWRSTDEWCLTLS